MSVRDILVGSPHWPTGGFYPSDPEVLREALDELSPGRAAEERQRAIGVIAPHAGWQYSGPVMGEVFSRVVVPDRAVVLCPNHTGQGAPLALWPAPGSWRTPAGEVAIDEELNRLILAECAGVEEDAEAHASRRRPEHAIEVLLPFIQRHARDLRFSAIVVGESRWDRLAAVGEGLARVVESLGRERVLLVASSDMSHYEPDEVARRLDRLAIDCVERLDARRLLDVCEREGVSMCGRHPAAIVMTAARRLGASQGELLRYATSGDAPQGDRSAVVGYAGMALG